MADLQRPAAARGGKPRIVILGAGISGLCMGIGLKRRGFDNFVIFDKADDIGGTWRDNAYPGAACDVPSHLYSFSFAPNPDWSHRYSGQAEILAYLKDCADRFDLWPHIRLGTALTSARYDAAGTAWQLTTEDGDTHEADIFIAGSGQLSAPAYPDIPGRRLFQGPAFHSARWDPSVDLTGKRVAVIGTGASAIQFIPQIAKTAARVDVYQRSAPWVMPRKDRAYGGAEKWIFRHLPFLRAAYRAFIYWRLEFNFNAFRRESWLAAASQKRARRHLEEQIDDPALRDKLTPDYPIGCKRILLSDDYYPAINEPHVHLITEPIQKIGPDAVTADMDRPADVLIYGTGFKTLDFLAPLDVTGRDGIDLHETWRSGAHAYLGMSVAGFPNLFILYGPNTNLGHNSIIFMIECQVAYILKCLKAMQAEGWASLEVDEAAEKRFDETLQRDLARTAWAGDCRSWYKDASGRIVNNWSGPTAAYRRQTQNPNLAHFNGRPVKDPPAA